jgi:hypothetical protein
MTAALPVHVLTPRSCARALQAHKAYLDSTEHRTKAFKGLQASDAQAARVIEQRMRKLAKLQVRLVHTPGACPALMTAPMAAGLVWFPAVGHHDVARVVAGSAQQQGFVASPAGC